ncbi:hypothetical protein [Streptomyces sp. NPDC051364]|uniref:hypothetical protein n=1 Tax=Streptomyces sp. NPDC051364 TaxID=3155799 RepID=UPI0034298EA3
MTLLPLDGFAATIVPLAVAVPLMAGASVVLPRLLHVRRTFAAQTRDLVPLGLLWAVVVAVVFFAAVDVPAPFGWMPSVSIGLTVVLVVGVCVRVWTEARRDARLAAVVRRWLDELEPHSQRLRHYVVDPTFSDELLVHARQAAERGTGNVALEAFATGVVDLERAVEASPGRGAGAPTAEDTAVLRELATRVRDFDLTVPLA